MCVSRLFVWLQCMIFFNAETITHIIIQTNSQFIYACMHIHLAPSFQSIVSRDRLFYVLRFTLYQNQQQQQQIKDTQKKRKIKMPIANRWFHFSYLQYTNNWWWSVFKIAHLPNYWVYFMTTIIDCNQTKLPFNWKLCKHRALIFSGNFYVVVAVLLICVLYAYAAHSWIIRVQWQIISIYFAHKIYQTNKMKQTNEQS